MVTFETAIQMGVISMYIEEMMIDYIMNKATQEEVYPLCKGNGEKECHDCCLFEDYDVYNSPFDY